MNVECVTLDEVLAAGAVRGASLVPESSGYLALAISDAISRLPLRVDSGAVAITTEGAVTVTRQGEVLPARDAARHMREILRRLLSVSTGSMPGLSATASPRPESDRGIDAFVAELEAALVPVNRSAGRRVLARLARETARARQAGRLKLAMQAPARVAPAPAPEPPSPARVAQTPEPVPAVPARVAQTPEPEPAVPARVAHVLEPEPCTVSNDTDIDGSIELVVDASVVEPPADSATDVDAPVEFAFQAALVAKPREATPTAPELPRVTEEIPAGDGTPEPQDDLAHACFSAFDPDCAIEELPTELVTDDLAPLLDGITTPAERGMRAAEVAPAEPPAQFTPVDVIVQFTPVDVIVQFTPVGPPAQLTSAELTPVGPPAQLTPAELTPVGPPAELTSAPMIAEFTPAAPAPLTAAGPPVQLTPVVPAVRLTPVAGALQFTPAGPPVQFTPANPTPAAPPSHTPVDSFAHLTPSGTTIPWPVGLGMNPPNVHRHTLDVAGLPMSADAGALGTAVPAVSEPINPDLDGMESSHSGADILDLSTEPELSAEPEPSLDAPEVLELSAEPEPSLESSHVESRAEPELDDSALHTAEPVADANGVCSPPEDERSTPLPEPAELPSAQPAPEPCAAQADLAPIAASRVEELLASFAASSGTDFRATAAGLKRLAGLDATLTPAPVAVCVALRDDSDEAVSVPAAPAPEPSAPVPARVPVSSRSRRIAAAIKLLFAFVVAALAGAVIVWHVLSLVAPAAPSQAAEALPGASHGAPCPRGGACLVLAATP